jgi:2-methylisocitrate lyase-like PEP mutase family enzyme
MARIGRSFDVPLIANMVEGGRTPVLPRARLQELGYRIAIFPVTGLLAAARALEKAYGALKETGSSDAVSRDLYGFDRFCRLAGFEQVWEFEKRWPEV